MISTAVVAMLCALIGGVLWWCLVIRSSATGNAAIRNEAMPYGSNNTQLGSREWLEQQEREQHERDRVAKEAERLP